MNFDPERRNPDSGFHESFALADGGKSMDEQGRRYGADQPAATSPATPPAADPKKWWNSMTVWGTLLTAATAVVPLASQALGHPISAEAVQTVGTQAITAAQAIGAVAGTILSLWGRARATQPLAPKPGSMQCLNVSP
jgi:hypothetical protein